MHTGGDEFLLYINGTELEGLFLLRRLAKAITENQKDFNELVEQLQKNLQNSLDLNLK